MSAKLIDGKAIAASVRAEVREKVAELTARTGVRPGLTVVLVGEDPASRIYVRNKGTAAGEAGIVSHQVDLPASTAEKELLDLVARLNGIYAHAPEASQLIAVIGAAALGVRNCLCIAGDHQSFGKAGKLLGHPGAKNVYVAMVLPSGKLVVSAVDAFNNSSFNAIAASNPTQPLPPEYPSDKAFFTVTFFYNEQPPR